MDTWKEKLSCALTCKRCDQSLTTAEPRILSVYDHEAICMACKSIEEKKADYEEVSKQAIGKCLADTEIQWGDPEGYCYHHFYPFSCEKIGKSTGTLNISFEPLSSGLFP